MLHDEAEAREFVAARCSAGAMARLELLIARLREENAAQNLVASSTLDSVWLRHIADSAQLLGHVSALGRPSVPRETAPWLDLGAGAGFPGLVISIIHPEREVILVESRNLRIRWLESMIMDLNLRKCRVLGRDVRRVDTIEAGVISARAFAPLVRLIEVSARFSTKATEWVLPKGRSATQDIAQLPLPLRTRFHVKQSLTDPEAGIVVARGRMEWPR